jgi:hypothetical protein
MGMTSSMNTGSGGFRAGLVEVQDPLQSSVEFLASQDYTVKRSGITIDSTTVTADADGNKIVKGGTALYKRAATGKYTPVTSQEIQTVTVTGSPTGGTFTLTYSGQTTAGIAYNATAAAVRTALEALSNIAVGDVTVTGSAGGPYTVTFTAGGDVAQMTASGASLTGGSSPGVTVATATGGGTGADAVAKGLLFPGDVNLRYGDVVAGLLIRGSVIEARCTGITSQVKTDLGDRFIWQ